MSEQNDQLTDWRAQRQAVELCRAVSANDITAAESIYRADADAGLIRELVSALTSFAVSLARTVAEHDDTITENAIWQGLADRAETGIAATAEIAELTKENDK